MIDFRLDIGATQSVLTALDNPGLAAKAAKAAAESYNDEMHDWIDAGRAFRPGDGRLKQSVNWRPLSDGAEVFANADYAGFVEHGTGVYAGRSAWVIKPKAGRKGLKIPASGGLGYFIRRAVRHSGAKPFPFFFADAGHRSAAMLAAARLVIFSAIEAA